MSSFWISILYEQSYFNIFLLKLGLLINKFQPNINRSKIYLNGTFSHAVQMLILFFWRPWQIIILFCYSTSLKSIHPVITLKIVWILTVLHVAKDYKLIVFDDAGKGQVAALPSGLPDNRVRQDTHHFRRCGEQGWLNSGSGLFYIKKTFYH